MITATTSGEMSETSACDAVGSAGTVAIGRAATSGLPLPYGHDRLVRRYGMGRNGFFLRRVFFLHRLRRSCLRCWCRRSMLPLLSQQALQIVLHFCQLGNPPFHLLHAACGMTPLQHAQDSQDDQGQ